MSNTIRENVILFRKRNGLTQAGLAKLIGMNRNTYAYHEKDGNFDIETLLKIARTLDVTLDDILNPAQNKTPIFQPAEPQKTTRLGQSTFFPEPDKSSELSYTEENLINIYRFLSSERKDQLLEFVNTLYHEERSRNNRK